MLAALCDTGVGPYKDIGTLDEEVEDESEADATTTDAELEGKLMSDAVVKVVIAGVMTEADGAGLSVKKLLLEDELTDSPYAGGRSAEVVLCDAVVGGGAV